MRGNVTKHSTESVDQRAQVLGQASEAGLLLLPTAVRTAGSMRRTIPGLLPVPLDRLCRALPCVRSAASATVDLVTICILHMAERRRGTRERSWSAFRRVSMGDLAEPRSPITFRRATERLLLFTVMVVTLIFGEVRFWIFYIHGDVCITSSRILIKSNSAGAPILQSHVFPRHTGSDL